MQERILAALILGFACAAHAEPPVLPNEVRIAPIPGALAGTPAHPYLAGLLDSRVESLDARAAAVVSAASVLSGPDQAALVRALAEDPEATAHATALTRDLRKQGLIPNSDEVVGVKDQQVLTAPSDQVLFWQQ